MPRQPSKHHNFWTPFLFFLLLILGVFIGFQLNRYIGSKRPITTVIERNDRMEELIDLINDRYVDSVNTDSLYKDAIKGILKNLDPHTTYIPASEVASVNAKLNGKFQGIGIELFNINDTMMVSKVIAGSPAQEAGLRLGDRLIAIDSIPIVKNSLSLNELRNMIAQKDNRQMFVTVIHAGSNAPVKLKLQQGVVPLHSISAAYMADPTTGYIKIDQFSAVTSREFNKALSSLEKQGMQQLILDLRDNPGGYVDAATAVANEFLGRHHLIVYTQGRTVERQNYYADDKGIFEKGRLAVLVNVETASAAEILTGAIQDWDRGVIIGQRTFGKGLVQQQFELGDGSLLRLTIARYYTPSGRSIQRPYSAGRAAYEASFLYRLYHPGSAAKVFSDSLSKTQKVYFSMKNHRVLRGGGGILPDLVIAKDPPFSEQAMLNITSGKWMEETAFTYFIEHYQTMSKFRTAADLAKKFKTPNDLMNRLKIHLDMVYPQATFVLWQNPLALDYIRHQLKAQMILLLFGSNDYYRFLNRKDVDFERAEKVLNNPAAYLQIIDGQAA